MSSAYAAPAIVLATVLFVLRSALNDMRLRVLALSALGVHAMVLMVLQCIDEHTNRRWVVRFCFRRDLYAVWMLIGWPLLAVVLGAATGSYIACGGLQCALKVLSLLQ